MTSKEGISICKLDICEYPTYKDNDLCILHYKSAQKDEYAFNKAIQNYVQKNDWHFNSIHFPKRFIIYQIPDHRIIFSYCHFYGEFKIPSKGRIKNEFILDGCTFEQSVFIDSCSFEGHSLFSGNKFLGSCSFSHTSFSKKVTFFYNKFEHGINLYNVKANKNEGLDFRQCEMGTSFFYGSTIQSMNFILCKWNTNFRLAEEVYDLVIATKFGHLGVPNTYLNRLFAKVVQLGKWTDSLVKIFLRNEYTSQKNMKTKNSSVYITHTNWNDYEMAEDTYRKLRLRYFEQGEPEIAGKYFYREKVSQRRNKKSFNRITGYLFKELIIGYGEKPWNVLISSMLIIFGYNIYYWYSNMIMTTANDKVVAITDFISTLYFSIVTFTTLGYGDYHPLGSLRIIAATEAFIGVIMMSLFVVILTRKYIR